MSMTLKPTSSARAAARVLFPAAVLNYQSIGFFFVFFFFPFQSLPVPGVPVIRMFGGLPAAGISEWGCLFLNYAEKTLLSLWMQCNALHVHSNEQKG